jgi:thiamine pyrophosphate-dependent acetolactate synthase large subunit-like protein
MTDTMTTGDIIVDKLIEWNIKIIFGIIGDLGENE